MISFRVRNPELLPQHAEYADYVRVIDIPLETQGKLLEVIMDGEKNALGYLRHYPTEKGW